MDEQSGWMEIVNLKKLIEFSRKVVYSNFDSDNDSLTDTDFLSKVENLNFNAEDLEEINYLLPMKECEIIFFEHILIRTKKKRHRELFMKEGEFDMILVELNKRMISNIVQSLVKKGALETAFDNEKNDFIFWVKEDYVEDKTEEDI